MMGDDSYVALELPEDQRALSSSPDILINDQRFEHFDDVHDPARVQAYSILKKLVENESRQKLYDKQARLRKKVLLSVCSKFEETVKLHNEAKQQSQGTQKKEQAYRNAQSELRVNKRADAPEANNPEDKETLYEEHSSEPLSTKPRLYVYTQGYQVGGMLTCSSKKDRSYSEVVQNVQSVGYVQPQIKTSIKTKQPVGRGRGVLNPEVRQKIQDRNKRREHW